MATVLEMVGVDVSLYSAHSTRGSATSKAVGAKVTIQNILKTADWASVSTFNTFYNRRNDEDNTPFGREVLSLH